MNKPIVHYNLPALPQTSAALAALRKIKSKASLNDQVETIHVRLWDDPTYQKLWEAAFNQDAVEGSLAADNFAAAQRVREYAKEAGNEFVEAQKLAAIVRSLGVATRRYPGQSRKERQAVATPIVNGADAEGTP